MRFLHSFTHFSVRNFIAIETLSIKNLTLLGFTLVALPLVIALIYSATQVNQLSIESENAIFDVAELIKYNREMSESITKMERFSSQYLVLQDQELLNNYQLQAKQLSDSIKFYLNNASDSNLQQLSNRFLQLSNNIEQLILQSKTPVSLEKIQTEFKKLTQESQKINWRINEIIKNQAADLKSKADKVSAAMLRSLLIIPLIIVVAGIFILLITKPLKKLIKQIQRLERGNFENKFCIQGSSEILEIADALEIMRTRLHALELQKSSFIRHISHELKTPLAAIKTGIELLDDSSVGTLNKEQQEVSNIIASSVGRLQKLIEDLLDFNIVLDSTSLQDREKLDLNVLLNNVISNHVLAIKHKNIVINKQFPPLVIYCNAKQLQVIFDNLLSNAIKFSPQDGIITIKSAVQNDRLSLSVTDDGIGIASHLQNKIFTAFYQGTPPENNQIKSSGLGLTIVKELVMRLNGNIEVVSNVQESTGSTFILSLPRAYTQRNKKLITADKEAI